MTCYCIEQARFKLAEFSAAGLHDQGPIHEMQLSLFGRAYRDTDPMKKLEPQRLAESNPSYTKEKKGLLSPSLPATANSLSARVSLALLDTVGTFVPLKWAAQNNPNIVGSFNLYRSKSLCNCQ
jgi:hypothetical protein